MKRPKGLLYTPTHEWVEFVEDDVVRVGVTECFQKNVGELLAVNLPRLGDTVVKEKGFVGMGGDCAASGLCCPVTGVVTQVNTALLETPEAIGRDPYGSWLVEISEVTDVVHFLDDVEYDAVCQPH